jgi:hypothetical protein
MTPVEVTAVDYGGYAVALALSKFRLLAACPGCAARLDPCRVRAAVALWEGRQREHTRVLAWSRTAASYRVTAREESDHQMLMVSLGPARTQAPGFRS